ncbi:hypothetical protein OSTOST_01902, partial [Ostertagia ostertagi]
PALARFEKIPPLKVTDLKAIVSDLQVSLSWNVSGVLLGEEPNFKVNIYNHSEFGNKSAKAVLSRAIKYGQEPRVTFSLPAAGNYVAEVIPFIRYYLGIPSSVNIVQTASERIGPPTDVQLAFHSPTSTTISFTAPRQTNDDKECEVNICSTKALSKKCSKKLVKPGLSSASF